MTTTTRMIIHMPTGMITIIITTTITAMIIIMVTARPAPMPRA